MTGVAAVASVAAGEVDPISRVVRRAYSSWLTQVERWFGLIIQRTVRRGSHHTARERIRRIATFVTS